MFALAANQSTELKPQKKNVYNLFISDITTCELQKKEIEKFLSQEMDHKKMGSEEKYSRNYRPEKQHECEICNKKFSESSSLERHLLVHRGEKLLKCNVCDKKFTYLSRLERHLRVHNGEKPYECKICNKRFVESGTLKQHLLIHSGEKPHQCNICNKRFTYSSHLNRHLRIHRREKPHQCNYCEKKFSQLDNLKRHLRYHYGEKPYECKICNKKFVESCHLKQHLGTHKGKVICSDKITYELSREQNVEKKSNNVSICNVKQKMEYSLCYRTIGNEEKQSRTCSTEKQSSSASRCDPPLDQGLFTSQQKIAEQQYVCKICNEKFGESGTFQLHLVTHKGKISCSESSREQEIENFSNNGTICNVKPEWEHNQSCEIIGNEEKHSQTYSTENQSSSSARFDPLLDKVLLASQQERAEKQYECKISNEQVVESSNLKRHIIVRSGEKPLQCSICDKKFTCSSHLKRHLRVHSGEKPYECKICNKRFVESGTLKQHLLIHSGEKPHQCNICHKRFTYSSHLKRHLRIHSREKPHQCNYCEKKFSQLDHLKRHLRYHYGEKPYECKICNKRFVESGHLKHHLVTHKVKKVVVADMASEEVIVLA